MRFLVYLYYTQPFYRTSTFGQNHPYCIRIFTVERNYVADPKCQYICNHFALYAECVWNCLIYRQYLSFTLFFYTEHVFDHVLFSILPYICYFTINIKEINDLHFHRHTLTSWPVTLASHIDLIGSTLWPPCYYI